MINAKQKQNRNDYDVEKMAGEKRKRKYHERTKVSICECDKKAQ